MMPASTASHGTSKTAHSDPNLTHTGPIPIKSLTKGDSYHVRIQLHGRLRKATMTIYKKFVLLFLAWCVGSMLGCAGIARFERESGETDRIQELLRNQESYAVHAAIWPANRVVALVFDPKSDERVILTEGWTRVEKDLSSSVKKMSAGTSPGLFSILGPDGQRFGYLYTFLPGLQTQVVDERTLRFYYVKPPPAPAK